MTNQISFLRGVPSNESLLKMQPCLGRLYKEVIDKYGVSVLQYKSPIADFLGFKPLCDVLAVKYDCDKNHTVVCSNGGLETLSMIFKMGINAKRPILTEAFTYDRVLHDAAAYGLPVLGVKFFGSQVDLLDLENLIVRHQPSIFYQIPFSQNPTGYQAEYAHLKEIAQLCKEHNVLYILDIAYDDLRYDGQANYKIDLEDEVFANVVLLGSFTKTISPGAKCGFGIIPNCYISQLEKIISNTRLNPNYPTQAVLAELFKRGLYSQQIEFLQTLYEPKMSAFNQALEEHFAEETMVKITGGFFALLQLPTFSPDYDYVENVAKKGVIINIANVCPPNIKVDKTLIRLTFPALSVDEISLGIKVMKEVMS